MERVKRGEMERGGPDERVGEGSMGKDGVRIGRIRKRATKGTYQSFLGTYH